MTAIPDAARARRYLLGEASDEECDVLEQEYFAHQDAVDRIAAAEEDLIEDYLAGQLSPGERERFERTYLAAPQHRVRVATIRRLMAHGARAAQIDRQKQPALPQRRLPRPGPWLALAASLLIVASWALWMFSPFSTRPSEMVDNRRPEPSIPVARDDRPSTPPAARRIFALTVSPAGVRGGATDTGAAIPAGTDDVALRLESDGESRQLTARRASVRTVSGREVWQGPVTAERDRVPGAVARIVVPASSLPPDDYLITLYGSDRAGTEREWTQYFLRVQSR
jgi:hypothetical protein